MDQLESVVWPLIEQGKIKPIIDTTFAISDADAAHRHVASNETVGKVVLEVPQ
jgi:NADPH:quinone reductase-like Zn-dependent oxidoreductase